MKVITATLVYNTPSLANSILDQMNGHAVVFDNGSSIDLGLPVNTLVYRSERNLLFAGGWNAFMMSMVDEQVDYVWMLNSDVEKISEHMRDQLVKVLEKIDDIALVTPAFNSPHEMFRTRKDAFIGWIDWCCPMVKVRAWKDIGPLDEAKFPGYGADIDWCYRAKMRGWRLFLAGNQYVHHIGQGTSSEEEAEMRDAFGMNEGLCNKWSVNHWTDLTR